MYSEDSRNYDGIDRRRRKEDRRRTSDRRQAVRWSAEGPDRRHLKARRGSSEQDKIRTLD
jgi:hypothetical protein